jgi:hypothetical protein
MRRTDRRAQKTATAPIIEQAPTSSARFISPMLLLRTDFLPDSLQ